MNLVFRSESEVDTRALGRRLASFLRPNDVIALCGELGSGKTAFAAGLAEGLGISERVTSPSFILSRRYDGGFMPLVHADVYRLTSMAEFDDLGVFEEARDAVLVVEWGDAVMPELPSDQLTMEIQVVDESTRILRLFPRGRWAERPLEELG
ncbi:MAG: tRNA (adenosine(37)-N6)-threonylcarbamoyltransferase complex ATPase subunit type 1 TsaE [Acidimicrobiia bacterium]